MIILTGASGGIGKAILPMLAAIDDVVAVYHSRKPEDIVLDNIVTQQVDLSSSADIKNFVVTLSKSDTNITILHAAALSRNSLVANFIEDDWEQVIDVNLRSNFLLTKALLPLMIHNKWGRIVHFSSVAALTGVPGTLAYSSAKTGLFGMSRVMANEYARFGITSNILILGYFNTGLIETLSEKAQKKVLSSIPSGKLGNPLEIGNAIQFLINSGYVNGSTIHIDGGI